MSWVSYPKSYSLSRCACSRSVRCVGIGGTRTIPIDVRLIAATNRNLRRGGTARVVP